MTLKGKVINFKGTVHSSVLFHVSHMKLLCGLSLGTRSGFLERDIAAVELFQMYFFFQCTTSEVPSTCVSILLERRQTPPQLISKIGRRKSAFIVSERAINNCTLGSISPGLGGLHSSDQYGTITGANVSK